MPCVHWYVQSALSQAVADVNVAAIEVRLHSVLVPLEGSSLVAMPLLQLSVQQHLRDPVVLHPDDVSCPSQLTLDDQALNAGEAAILQDLEVEHSVLPLRDVADLPQRSADNVGETAQAAGGAGGRWSTSRQPDSSTASSSVIVNVSSVSSYFQVVSSIVIIYSVFYRAKKKP